MHDELQKALGETKAKYNKEIRIDKVRNEILKNATPLGPGLYAVY